jgi:hypothetical protein
MEEDFYSTIKLKSGEEIFAKVSAMEEEDKTLLIILNPIMISEIKNRFGVSGYKFEPWMKTTTEDMFVINLNDVLTMSESFDIEMIVMYQSYVRQLDTKGINESKPSKTMGYLSNVNDAKEILEKLYKIS